MRWLYALLIAAMCAAPRVDAEEQFVKRIPAPDDAVAIAHRHLAGVAPADQVHMRYVYVLEPSVELTGTLHYVLNSVCSTVSEFYTTTTPLADGHVVQIDLRQLAASPVEYTRLVAAWEKFADEEPYFYRTELSPSNEPAGAKEAVGAEQVAKTLDALSAYLAASGQSHVTGWGNYLQLEQLRFQLTRGFEADQAVVAGIRTQFVSGVKGLEFKQFVAVRQAIDVWLGELAVGALAFQDDERPAELAQHTGIPEMLGLITLTKSRAPIVRADWMLRTLTSTVDGGRYYDFRGIRKSSDGKTALEWWLESVGGDQERVEKLRSDERTAMEDSGVTAKPRSISFFPTVNVPATIGPGTVYITNDFFDGPIDGLRHPLKNLLRVDADGHEAIGFLRNGMLSFALFDAKGELANVAPQELVTDSTIPSPHTANLVPMISCIRCHYPKHDGFLPAPNEIKAALDAGLVVFDDPSTGLTQAEALDRIRGLYKGDVEEALRLSRNTHAIAVFRATGGMTVSEVGATLADAYRKFWYDAITPKQACLELGYVVDTEEHAAALFDKIVPKLAPNQIGVKPESIIVHRMRNWDEKKPQTLTRHSWQDEYAAVALRARNARTKQEAADKKAEGKK